MLPATLPQPPAATGWTGSGRGAATAPRKNARALELAQKKQVVDVPREQREQQEDDAV